MSFENSPSSEAVSRPLEVFFNRLDDKDRTQFEVDFNKAHVIHHANIRPLEVSVLRGDSSKIQSELGWKPEYDWASLLKEMYESDYASVLNSSGRKKTETTTAE